MRWTLKYLKCLQRRISLSIRWSMRSPRPALRRTSQALSCPLLSLQAHLAPQMPTSLMPPPASRSRRANIGRLPSRRSSYLSKPKASQLPTERASRTILTPRQQSTPAWASIIADWSFRLEPRRRTLTRRFTSSSRRRQAAISSTGLRLFISTGAGRSRVDLGDSL